MASVKHNVIANISGSAWTAIMGFVFVPVYLHFLGAEGFGLIGVFTTLSGILTLLDVGFGAAASRHLARLDLANTDDVANAHSLVYTLERLFWGIAILLGTSVVALAPFIANQWLNTELLNQQSTTNAIRLMGLTIILQWPVSLYSGCLMGLQRQVGLNVLGAAIASLKGFGGALILWLVSPTVETFFVWQLLLALMNVISVRQLLWATLPSTSVPSKFSLERLRELGRFAMGIVGLNVLNIIVGQLDKVILSAMLPLNQFGYYMVASNLSILVLRIAGPIYNAVYPRLTELAARHDTEAIYSLYRRSTQLLAVIVFPFALLIAFFSRELVTLWTHNAALGYEIRWAQTWLVLSTMATGIMSVNGALLLAHGNISKSFGASAIVAILIFPVTYQLTKMYGIDGAAFASLALSFVNNGFVLLGIRKFLPPKELLHWLSHSVAIPLAGATAIYLVPALFQHEFSRNFEWISAVPILAAYILCNLILATVLHTTRHELISFLRLRSA